MTGILSAEQVQAILETQVDEMPLMIAEDPSVLVALARSHEALRSERDAALAERVGDRRDDEAPRVDKPAQVGTSRSANAASPAAEERA